VSGIWKFFPQHNHRLLPQLHQASAQVSFFQWAIPTYLILNCTLCSYPLPWLGFWNISSHVSIMCKTMYCIYLFVFFSDKGKNIYQKLRST
jgi:hypothetical protein